MSKTFYDITRDRWPMRYIKGAGQFAVIPLDDQTVRLFMTLAEAHAAIIAPLRAMVCDLQERSLPDFDRIPDLEDREERKARRREDRQRAHTAVTTASRQTVEHNEPNITQERTTDHQERTI